MDFRTTEASSDGSETSLDSAAQGLTRSGGGGLPVGVSRALADPIVKALMAADRVDPVGLEELLRRIAARLARHDPPNSSVRFTGRKKPTGSASLVKLAKGFVLSLAVIAGLAAVPGPAAADDAATAFIRTIGTQAVSVIRRPDMPLASKAAYFGQMVRQGFYLTGVF